MHVFSKSLFEHELEPLLDIGSRFHRVSGQNGRIVAAYLVPYQAHHSPDA